ncbi:MAG TPA: hypothetical protein VJN95_12785 [Gemmatimonadales bacterium]|nr:hypothetical protein [Gemmatimonadales bacterium]
MSEFLSLIDRIAATDSGLGTWREDAHQDDGVSPSLIWADLAHSLIDPPEDGVAERLRAIAPLIEEALERHDHQDAVSLGFIESFISLAQNRQWDTKPLRLALGPVGRQHWDALSDYLNQGRLIQIQFESKAIANCPSGSATLIGWLAVPGTRLARGGRVAEMDVGGQAQELVTLFECRVDRVALKAGETLPPGSLLCYLRPDDYRQSLSPGPFLELRLAVARD